ncbi:polyribonucleotide nucleotidyltransferase [Pontibacter ummariensis]|uniref:Polyribonucleotide nucleotidyltransferase n=1 Tax=Pontibacter ummariensis TaxID=1610492 RepID=A0A239BZ51_9BACT|nr:polyribonucleotide nucleotidyltransferase [Pontibacter ummariensis]PRY15536.1 polyribonucleotide nucleotidyltransferase [Pontibacter ummariensis]SNS13186.1 polyribonucleotide nucleotidyltransferase [Pontibacter ummariensis]
MPYNAINKTILLPDGREITIETGKLAKQADGSVVVKMGNTMLLAAVVSNKDAREGVDFLPLSVDYQEKFASSGKIPGGFLRREARLSDYEVLVSRLVDRVLRPLFPDDYHAETQMTINLISADTEIMPDALAALAASAALAVSDIPFNGPISEVRVARIDGQLVINPNVTDLQRADIDLMIGASIDSVVMVEGEMNEVSEAEMLEAIQFAHEAIKVQCQAQLDLAEMVGKTVKRTYSHETHDEELRQKVYDATYEKALEVARRGSANKAERKEGFASVLEAFVSSLPEDHTYDTGLIKTYFHDVEKEAVRNMVLNDRVRLDGRKLDEIRPIWTEVNYLPATHGSAIFTRGETQSLTTVTLGTKLDEQMIDSAMVSGTNKFLLHYNFPAFSTGEVRPNRGPGRREVGHGNLALRALKKVLPPEEENPYTIRIVSDILESNGSSSMATVCAGSLALMDAGVPVKGAVSGIAMGLITDAETGKWAVLSDILGDEDHLGDMDFKVAGTKDGITACQMDIKVRGLSYEILSQALQQANAGRLHILNEMAKTIEVPNPDYKPHTPRSFNMVIDKEFIGAVIGPGGKVIQQIQKDTGATIIIEEKNEKGHVNIFASNQDAMNSAVSKIKGIVAQPEVGEVYIGKVKSVQPYGAFVEFMPGKDGLLHISEIKHERLETMDGVLEIGEEVKVKLIDIDKKTGKFKLSRKAALPKPGESEQK